MNEGGTPLIPMGLGRSNDVPSTQHLRQGGIAEAQFRYKLSGGGLASTIGGRIEPPMRS